MVVVMGSLSIVLSSSSPLHQNHLKFQSSKTTTKQKNHISLSKPQISKSITKVSKSISYYYVLLNCLPSLASIETARITIEQQSSVENKINLESILVSIDDFFNRYPFFFATITFIYLLVIPLTQNYLRKYKFISALDAFRKLRDDPSSMLLDVRDDKSVAYLGSPNLKALDKSVVQIQFHDGPGFLSKVFDKFSDPPNTIVCVLDNFDGNSMKVAELLFKNGFKEAYAIKAGVRGKGGWQAIQEKLLPPSVHMYPRKKGETAQQLEVNEASDL